MPEVEVEEKKDDVAEAPASVPEEVAAVEAEQPEDDKEPSPEKADEVKLTEEKKEEVAAAEAQ